MTIHFLAANSILSRIFGTSLIIIILNALLVTVLLYAIWYIFFEYIIRQNIALDFLEINLPKSSLKSASQNIELFNAIRSSLLIRTPKEKLFRRKNSIALEIVSTKNGGLKYILVAATKDKARITKIIYSYDPGIKIKNVKDYMLKNTNETNVSAVKYRTSNHYAFPLNHENSEGTDPLNYLLGSMKQLKESELIAVQLVITPVRPLGVARLKKQLIKTSSSRSRVRILSINTVFIALWLKIFRIASEFLEATISGSLRQLSYKNFKVSRLNPAVDQEQISAINSKLSSPLFKCALRAVIITKSLIREAELKDYLSSAFGVFGNGNHQSIKENSSYLSPKRKLELKKFIYRSINTSPGSSMILSASELAGLYHLPNSINSDISGSLLSLSRQLPPPTSMMDKNKFDVILGNNAYQDNLTPIGLTKEDRERHVYILGGTGTGKSTLMKYSIIQDIRSGKGLAIIDPHGDLAESILEYIPESRAKDLIYFDPSDISHPLGLNIMQVDSRLTGDDLLLAQDQVTEQVISILRKLFSSENANGHRLEYILRNAVHTAFTLENCTIFTVYRLLIDTQYRSEVVLRLEDKSLISFWTKEYGQAGSMQRVKLSIGLTSKIGRLLRSPVTRRILGQPKSALDFDEIINSGKILICNFSKGKIGEDTSTLLGASVLAKLQIAAYKRAKIKEENRRPYYLYVDEFQNFATPSFTELLSEARKYKMYLTIAEQSPSQQNDINMFNVILTNVGTLISFRLGSPNDEKLIYPLFAPYIEQHEILNLPLYNFYIRISSTESVEPTSGQTILPSSVNK